jgi:hypothetical protein
MKPKAKARRTVKTARTVTHKRHQAVAHEAPPEEPEEEAPAVEASAEEAEAPASVSARPPPYRMGDLIVEYPPPA